MKEKLRVLISARDPASAHDIAEIVPVLLKDDNFTIKIIAQDAAYMILSERNFFPHTEKEKLIKFDIEKGCSLIQDIVHDFKPRILLTGISGPGFGVDEIALSVCSKFKDIKTFSIQSFWGDLNYNCGTLANTIFVLDEYAKSATLNRSPGTNTVVAGLFQSKKYDAINIKKERGEFKEKYSKNIKIIGFFGQPLLEYEWYRDTIEAFFESISKISIAIQVVYKPHPKESEESIQWTRLQLDKNNLNFDIEMNIDVLSVLCGTDIAVSLFSTSCFDLQQLLFRSNEAFSVPVYLFFDKRCVKWYKEYSYLDSIPFSDGKMASVIRSKRDIGKQIVSVLSVKNKKQCSGNIKFSFESFNKNPHHTIVQKLLNDSGFAHEKI